MISNVNFLLEVGVIKVAKFSRLRQPLFFTSLLILNLNPMSYNL